MQNDEPRVPWAHFRLEYLFLNPRYALVFDHSLCIKLSFEIEPTAPKLEVFLHDERSVSEKWEIYGPIFNHFPKEIEESKFVVFEYIT